MTLSCTKFEDPICFHTTQERDRQTDRQTAHNGTGYTYAQHALQGKNTGNDFSSTITPA